VRGREAVTYSNVPRSLRRSQVVADVEEEDDYELPQDAPYIPIEANTTAAAEKAKLETLEAELARLRAEMAMFMQAQIAAAAQAPTAGSNSPSGNHGGIASGAYGSQEGPSAAAGEPRTPTRRPVHGAPPAGLSVPPPPPPPPTSSFASSLLKSASSAAHTAAPSCIAAPSSHQEASSSSQLPQHQLQQNQQQQQPQRTHHHSLSLSDMVKTAGRNTLRKVEGERSPGGTVKREAKTASSNPGDMAEVIQQAMRRRFKSVSGSPDTKATQSRVSSEPSDFDE